MELAQKILNILVEQGDISEANAEEARIAATSSDTPLLDILIKKNWVDEEKIIKARALALNVPVIILKGRGISPEILNYIPEPVARRYKLIPFDIDKNSGKLKVAMTDPINLPLIEFLQAKSGKSVIPYLAQEEEILLKIDEEYDHGLSV